MGCYAIQYYNKYDNEWKYYRNSDDSIKIYSYFKTASNAANKISISVEVNNERIECEKRVVEINTQDIIDGKIN